MKAQESVEFLRERLSIYSPSGQEAPLAHYLAEKMARLGFDAYIDEVGNVIGELQGANCDSQLVFLGHMDPVEGFIPVRTEAGFIHGRGAVDAKGPLATFIAAAAQVGPLAGKRLIVVGAVEEEAATSKGARHIVGRFSPDFAIIGEPSSWDRITLGYKGRLLVDYSLEREMGHAAGRRIGACEEAVRFWNRLKGYAEGCSRGKGELFECLHPSLRRINSSDDGFIERVEATIGLRLPPGLDVEALKANIRDFAGEAKVVFYAQEAPFRASKNNPLVRAFLQSIREAGGHPAFKLKTGTSDMNVVGPVWGCPIVAYGPGDSSLDHTPHERLSLVEYEKAIEILTAVLQSL